MNIQQTLNTPVTFGSAAGSRAGIEAKIVQCVPRHGYVVVEVVKGNRNYRKGERLHTPISQLPAGTAK